VEDCVDGILHLLERPDGDVNVFNITTRGGTSVTRIAELVTQALGLPDTKLAYTGGSTGWRGDVARIQLDGSRAATMGWQARLSSDDAVVRTICALLSGN
jgi:UDP-glucose 4-epimerase